MPNEDHNTVMLFGKHVNLQEEWNDAAAKLSLLCNGNQYLEYEKELARLKVKLIHLQEEIDGCRAHNKNLSSMNDDLVNRVRDLISMQDGQLEQYSTALVLLTEERRDLWRTLSESQKTIKNLEAQMGKCKCRKNSSNEIDSIASSEESDANSEKKNSVACWVKTTTTIEGEQNVGTTLKQELEEVETPQNVGGTGDRCLDSLESSLEHVHDSNLVKMTPVRGAFVNSMIEKIEKKHKLKSFEEPKLTRHIDVENISSPEPSEHPSESEVDVVKSQMAVLEQEVIDLRDTCQTLTNMLERTYEEMHPTDSQSEDDTKDQLIACLRSRLFEAICDLMKVEKTTKSVACGSSLPRSAKSFDAKRNNISETVVHSASHNRSTKKDQFPRCTSDSALSPSKFRPSKLLTSPASKLKAIGEEKLKKFSCWKAQESFNESG